MKNIIALSVVVLLIGCKASNITTDKLPYLVTSSEVKATVSFLASDDLMGRDTGSEGIDEAAKYLESEFKTYGLKSYFNTYRDNFKVEELDAFNVVAYLEGNDTKLKDEFIIIGAHYDHIGIKEAVDNDSIANGANDNAAGTAAVMAMAKYFSVKKSNKRSLMFVLFSGEEKGLLGSKHLAKKLKDENLNLYTVFNIEMLGTPMIGKDFKGYLTGHKLSNMSEKFNEYIGDSNYFGLYDMAEKFQLFKRSDNYPFYLEFNVPAQSYSTSDNYEYYHKVDDEVDKLNFDHLASAVNAVIPAIEKMSITPTKEIIMYPTKTDE